MSMSSFALTRVEIEVVDELPTLEELKSEYDVFCVGAPLNLENELSLASRSTLAKFTSVKSLPLSFPIDDPELHDCSTCKSDDPEIDKIVCLIKVLEN